MTDVDITVVQEWAHIKFDRPVQLIPRSEIRPGDLIQSSHGYKLFITRNLVSQHPHGTAYFWGDLHEQGSEHTETEIYDKHHSVPVFSRGGIGWMHRPHYGVATFVGDDYVGLGEDGHVLVQHQPKPPWMPV